MSSTWLRVSRITCLSRNCWVWLILLVCSKSSRTCKQLTVMTMLNFINLFFAISLLENTSESSSKKKPKLLKLMPKLILTTLPISWKIITSTKFNLECVKSGCRTALNSVKLSLTKLVLKSWLTSWNSNLTADLFKLLLTRLISKKCQMLTVVKKREVNIWQV